MKIWNSSGNSVWEPTTSQEAASALQAAINEQHAEGGGTVWCETESVIELSGPIFMRSNVILDLQNAGLEVVPNTSAFVIENCVNASIRNAQIRLRVPKGDNSHQSEALIVLRTGSTSETVAFNSFHKIRLFNASNHSTVWPAGFGPCTEEPCGGDSLTFWHRNYDGICLQNRAGTILGNLFEHIYAEGVRDVVRIVHPSGSSGVTEGNVFYDVYAEGFEAIIHFDADDTLSDPQINYNLLYHASGQTKATSYDGPEDPRNLIPYARYVVRDLCGHGNHLDHFMSYDWHLPNYSAEWWPTEYVGNSPPSDLIISSRSINAYLCPQFVNHLIDNGACTAIRPRQYQSIT